MTVNNPFELASGNGPERTFKVSLSPIERRLTTSAAREVKELIEAGHPTTIRLAPPGYSGGGKAEREYQALVASELRGKHLQALDTLVATSGNDTVPEEILHQWLAAVEAVRLTLGTELNITEDMEDPSQERLKANPKLALYLYVTWLQSQLVDALFFVLPTKGSAEPGSP